MKKSMVIVSNVNATCQLVVPYSNLKAITDMLQKAADAHPELNNTWEVFQAGEMPLEKLPAEIQEAVKSTLKAFHNCNVYYEYGEFHSSASVGIKSSYNWDHFVCGSYRDVDVYTEEERRQNYIECFG